MSNSGEQIGIHSEFPTAAHFWRLVVIPDYIACRHEETARNIFHAATSIWHLQEWIFAERDGGHPSLSSFIRDLEQRCPALGLLRDVADAGKHRYLDRPSVQVQSAKSTTPGAIKPGGVVSTTIIATIKRKDGSGVFVSDTLITCIDFLRREFFPEEPAADAQYKEYARAFHRVYSPTFIEKLILWIDPLAGHNRIAERSAHFDVLKFGPPLNAQLTTNLGHLIAAIRAVRSKHLDTKSRV